MHKFILFTSTDDWGSPNQVRGDQNLKKSFGEIGRSFGTDHFVLFAGVDAKGAEIDHASNAVAIVWEPPLGKSYKTDQKKRIQGALAPFIEKATHYGLALHYNTEPLTWERQRSLIKYQEHSRSTVAEKKYHHSKTSPYTLFCDAITAAGTARFEGCLEQLSRDFFKQVAPAIANDDLSNPSEELGRMLGGDTGWLHNFKGAKTLLGPTRKGLASDQSQTNREDQYNIIKGHPADYIERRITEIEDLRRHQLARADPQIAKRMEVIASHLGDANRTWHSIKGIVAQDFTNDRADKLLGQLEVLSSMFETIELEVSDVASHLKSLGPVEK